jgi:hypothetical protein
MGYAPVFLYYVFALGGSGKTSPIVFIACYRPLFIIFSHNPHCVYSPPGVIYSPHIYIYV